MLLMRELHLDTCIQRLFLRLAHTISVQGLEPLLFYVLLHFAEFNQRLLPVTHAASNIVDALLYTDET